MNGGEEGRLVGGWGVEVGAVCLWLVLLLVHVVRSRAPVDLSHEFLMLASASAESNWLGHGLLAKTEVDLLRTTLR